jgi:DNA-binding CsgD family transcriptional regulator
MFQSLIKLENLLQCKSFADLHKETAAIVQELGFEHFLFGLRMEIVGQPTEDFVLSGYPDRWWEAYQQHRFDRIDPIVTHCKSSHRPLLWEAQHYQDPYAATMFEEAAFFDIRSGVSVPLHGSVRREFGLLSLASGDASLGSHTEQVLGQGQLLANFLYEAVQKIAAKQLNVLSPTLTPREHECIRWAAAGKSSWEISCILRTSERTIYFHICNVIAKLNVVNRQQAIAKGMALGLI